MASSSIAQSYLSVRDRFSIASQTARLGKRRRTNSPETIESVVNTEDLIKDKGKGKDKGHRKKSRASGPTSSQGNEAGGAELACPFSKWKPEFWGGPDACGLWKNCDINVLFRHHINQRHRQDNDRMLDSDPRHLDSTVFRDLDQWRSGHRLEKKKTAELWKILYMKLFRVPESEKNAVPDPYFIKDSVDNADHKLDTSVRQQLLTDPNLTIKYRGCLLEVTRLQAARDSELNKVEAEFNQRTRVLQEERDVARSRVYKRYEQQLDNIRGPSTNGPTQQLSSLKEAHLQEMETMLAGIEDGAAGPSRISHNSAGSYVPPNPGPLPYELPDMDTSAGEAFNAEDWFRLEQYPNPNDFGNENWQDKRLQHPRFYPPQQPHE